MPWLIKLSHAWDRISAEQYLRTIHPILRQLGFDYEIYGSVALNGYSDNDLDIRLVPVSDDADWQTFERAFPGGTFSITEQDLDIGQTVYHMLLPDGRSVDFFFDE